MPLELTIPEAKDVITGNLAKAGNWIVASVSGRVSWCVKSQRMTFRGVELNILPVMKGHYPGVAINRPPGMKSEDAERVIMRFLSVLSWVEGHGIMVEGFTGGNIPRSMGRRDEFGLIIQDEFNFSYFPEPENEKACIALGLMREGRGLNHPAYAFLSFYRVLEIALPNGKKRGAWIKENVDKLTDHQANEVIKRLKEAKVDIGEHLYEGRRMAIAHAAHDPVLDPDDPSEARKLYTELPLITALAELAIEKELGIETSRTVYKNHLYELAGFKDVIGAELIDIASTGKETPEDATVYFPSINVGLRKHEQFKSLTNLALETISREGSHFVVHFISSDKVVNFRFRLDFPNERLLFNPDEDIWAVDNETPEAAEALADRVRFLKGYWLNGELRITDAETGRELSRKDPFIPVNVYVQSVEPFNEEIERCVRLAEERRTAAKQGS